MSKIEQARAIIRSVGAPRVLLMFSGGKDSLAMADLCVRELGAENVEAVYMYVVKGLQAFEAPVDSGARRLGIKLHKIPHWMLSQALKLGVFMPRYAAAKHIKKERLADAERRAREVSGLEWIGSGWKRPDSIQRHIVLSAWGPVYEKGRRFFPLFDWTNRDVVAYLEARKIRRPIRIGAYNDEGGSGFDLRPSTLLYLREHHPDDFAKMLEVFPWAEIPLMRLQFHNVVADPRGLPAELRARVTDISAKAAIDKKRGLKEEAARRRKLAKLRAARSRAEGADDEV